MRKLLISAALLALLLTGCGGGGGGDEAASRPGATGSGSAMGSLRDVASVEEFAALFNEEDGVPRLVLLLSPT